MGIRVVRAEVLELEAYVASRRILEKLGFMKQTVYEGCFRGEKKAMVVLERRWSDDDSSDQ